MKKYMKLALAVGVTVVTVIAAVKALAQIPPPALTIAPAVSNQVVITITNGVSLANYDLIWTPALNGPDYSWNYAAIGSAGQTNFTVDMEWPAAFFRAQVDTNGIPLWEAADPNNPSAGILAVFIDSPANGAVVQ